MEKRIICITRIIEDESLIHDYSFNESIFRAGLIEDFQEYSVRLETQADLSEK